MITKRRMFYASAASAAAFFVVPAIGCFLAMQMPYLNLDSGPDNAPVRGVGIFILVSPVVFIAVATVTFVGALLLQHVKQLRPTVLAGTITVLSLGLGFLMVLDRPFGWYDALYYFVGFAASIFATLSLSILVWWKVATRTNKAVEGAGPQTALPSP
jgi:hypothetical protein